MAITASLQPESGRIVYAGSDFPDPLHFRFSEESMDRTVQNRSRSDLDGLAKVWLNSCGLKASWCSGTIWPGFRQDATGPLPVSHFQIRLHSFTNVPDNIVQNQPGSDLVLADCVRFWPNGSGPEASQCARIIRPASGQCFPADPACLLGWVPDPTLTSSVLAVSRPASSIMCGEKISPPCIPVGVNTHTPRKTASALS